MANEKSEVTTLYPTRKGQGVGGRLKFYGRLGL